MQRINKRFVDAVCYSLFHHVGILKTRESLQPRVVCDDPAHADRQHNRAEQNLNVSCPERKVLPIAKIIIPARTAMRP